MTAKDFFSRLESRKAGRYDARKNRATEQCPLKSGDILVAVYELSTMAPIKKMTVEIDGLGPAVTDEMGVAEWLEKPPGAYRYVVERGEKYAKKLWRNDAKNFALGGNAVSVHTAGVAASGALKVSVRLRRTGALLPAEHVLALVGTGETCEGEAEHLFENLPVGDYVVSAKLIADVYDATIVRGAAVEVEENKTAELTLEVDELSWVEVAVRDMTAPRWFNGCRVALEMPDGAALTPRTDHAGVARVETKGGEARCTLRYVATPGDEIYELIEII